MTNLTLSDLMIPSYCGLCALHSARSAKGAYDLHFERTTAEPDMPGQGPRVLATIRRRLATAGYRICWNGEQRSAIRIEPGIGEAPRLGQMLPQQVLARWEVDSACRLGARVDRAVHVEAALLTATESGANESVNSPAGFTRWLAGRLSGYTLDGDAKPAWVREKEYQSAVSFAAHLDAISYLREVARWASIPRGEVGVA